MIGIFIEASQIKFNKELWKAIKNIVNTRTIKKWNKLLKIVLNIFLDKLS